MDLTDRPGWADETVIPDIFISTCPKSDLRKALARLVINYWWISGLNPQIIQGGSFDPLAFQLKRRKDAEVKSTMPIYILSDDDCLPLSDGREWVEEACRIMERHSEFAILSCWPDNENIRTWNPDNYISSVNDLVEEHVSVGGVRFIRKGVMKEWPPMPMAGGYDAVHAEAMREQGCRVGYFKNFKMTHLGKGRSEVWTPEALRALGHKL